MTTGRIPTRWPSSPVKSPLGIFSGSSANTANSSNDQTGPIPPNGPPENEARLRMSASSETSDDKRPAQRTHWRGSIQGRIGLTLVDEGLRAARPKIEADPRPAAHAH